MEFAELIRILKTAESVEEIDVCREQIAKWFPKVRIMFDFDQRNKAHQYDLWMHCLHTVVNMPRNLEDDMLYLAAMLHDIGKPDSQVADANAHVEIPVVVMRAEICEQLAGACGREFYERIQNGE